jgi:hypothetical protein
LARSEATTANASRALGVTATASSLAEPGR